jgi:hypothetical protein
VTDPLHVRDEPPGSLGYTPGMTALTERDLAPEAPAPDKPSLERSAYSDQVFKGL